MEVVLKTFIEFSIQQDGVLWYVYVMGKRIGDGSRTRRTAAKRQAWLLSGIQDLIEAVDLMEDKAWKESGK